jgi:hypothetical protein
MILTLTNAPAGLPITARLRDGDEILATPVTVAPITDADGDPLDGYTATFDADALTLPVQLEWLQLLNGQQIRVGLDILTGSVLASWEAPHIDELAALTFARVTGEYGQAQTFTAESRPTAEQATTKLAQAHSMVAMRVGFDLDEQFHEAARFLTVLYAALLLEPGYWPEDSQGDRNAWDEWKALYDEGIEALLEAITGGEVVPDDGALSMAPIWYFGPPCEDHVPGSELPHEPVRCTRHAW